MRTVEVTVDHVSPLKEQGPKGMVRAVEPVKDIDPKRQAMLDRMAKARAVRAANLARSAAQAPPAVKPRGHKKPGRVKLQLEMEKERETKAQARAAKSMEKSLFAGISHQPYGCPAACTVDRCVITGENICQHPDDGGLQARYLTEGFSDVRGRWNQAKALLQRLDMEKSQKG